MQVEVVSIICKAHAGHDVDLDALLKAYPLCASMDRTMFDCRVNFVIPGLESMYCNVYGDGRLLFFGEKSLDKYHKAAEYMQRVLSHQM